MKTKMFFLLLLLSSTTFADDALLRIRCADEAADAMVYVNGKAKGECPLDMSLPPGNYKLRVVKKIDATHDGVFEKDLLLSDGVAKAVDVALTSQLSAEGKRQIQQAEADAKAAALRAEQERLAAEQAAMLKAEQQRLADEKAAAEKMAAEQRARIERAAVMEKLQGTYGKTWTMMPYEVTFDDWEECTDDGGCNEYEPDDMGWGEGKRPVVNVNYEDAVNYAQWLSKETGTRYRLPTEEEWEVAARAGTTTDYWWGNDIGVNNANCDGCGSKWGGKKTAPVGSFQPNAYGLYDTVGNVWEWTASCYDASCQWRMVRGGSWYVDPGYLSASYRLETDASSRNLFYGFRLVQEK